jgi:hypothetical protein
MGHLTPEQLLDLAEGTLRPGEVPHLRSCAMCARQVSDLRDAISAAAEATIPEPSPLFWDHLSARVRTAVAQEPPADEGRAGVIRWGLRIGFAAAALAALVLITGSTFRQPRSAEIARTAAAPVDVPDADAANAFDADPALTLLADLSADIDWDTASEAGLAPSRDAIDRVVLALTPEERLELQRILEEAMAASGA